MLNFGASKPRVKGGGPGPPGPPLDPHLQCLTQDQIQRLKWELVEAHMGENMY